MSKNLFNAVWDKHRVDRLETGQDQLFVGLHLIHEVTSPLAFQMFEERVYAKDVILKIIASLGVNGGIGYAYEYNGETIHGLSMEERMTICNMSIEGGARVGYVNPDDRSFEYLKGRPYAPQGEAFQ